MNTENGYKPEWRDFWRTSAIPKHKCVCLVQIGKTYKMAQYDAENECFHRVSDDSIVFADVLRWIPYPYKDLTRQSNNDVPLEVIYTHLVKDYHESQNKVRALRSVINVLMAYVCCNKPSKTINRIIKNMDDKTDIKNIDEAVRLIKEYMSQC